MPPNVSLGAIKTIQLLYPEQKIQVVKLHEGENLPNIKDTNAIIISGGEFGVYDAFGPNKKPEYNWVREQEVPFIETAIKADLPILGICFGHQLLGHMYGGEVKYRPDLSEIGCFTIALTTNGQKSSFFNKVSNQFIAWLYHNDHIITLPNGAVVLANSERTQFQALKLSDKVFGVQFHPEMWGEVSAFFYTRTRSYLEKLGYNIDELTDDTANISTKDIFMIIKNFFNLIED
ncbi:type 1 glutamine amidotransferase [Patescibacteria group bacterium]|nr:type 1 glutamine amidotransferase [Patescibacteria group bacterium]MBU1256685.1 type 1 glutamine amidotransferase [Patescibacteria group bacterium]MBU1457157.1 type 1 glutamine amidotransferase [Patescibacteria group bacterium]